ncbi:Hint domain-containing protein [Psychromarinibacter sp. C21-152]|uniref:Hint domain-containing protein n=1 Tax=Psychromarinibacter sediminicola TaxID=3033385 RepID=A0AAE3NQ78_9RHOB|nr:Hint domain-containing protein [Psychromarinibacter sediminicola]MDF0600086.1 Hint domain-containing protein [Psychromarinibacter sediminicola]
MSMQGFSGQVPAQGLPVFRAEDVVVSNGANLGDPMGHSGEVILDDIYNLAPAARRWRLNLDVTEGVSHFKVAAGSQMGRPGAVLHLDCCATFMAPDGAIVECLVLVELEADSALIAATYLLPLADLRPRTDYALVAIDTEATRAKFAHLACVSFTRGTHITMADGAQRPIEELSPGDMVLTRDNGPQPVRWIGQQTVRATGRFAPIVIAPGALNNAGELRLSPNQRLFVYQREDRLQAGRAEVVVKAEYLVNGDSVTRSTGGFVDYFQVLFDNHEFLFAEGIATESLTFDTRTSPALPREVQSKLGIAASGARRKGGPRPVELPQGTLDSAVAAETLRKATTL